MSNLFKKYETSSAKENDGVEFLIDDCVFVCRRAGGNNRLYKFAVADAVDEYATALKSEDRRVVADAEDSVTLKAFAEAVAVGWRNVLDRNEQPWPFTKENFIELMTSCPDVWLRLRVEARNVESFRQARAEEISEEVGKSLSGTTSGDPT